VVIFFRDEYLVPETCTTVVDAGANIGDLSLYFCPLRTTIYAFEPFPSTRARLTQTIDLNRLSLRVKIYPIALGDTNSGGSTRHMSDEGPSQSRWTLSESVARELFRRARWNSS
jgi:FkbM family methyltransferase